MLLDTDILIDVALDRRPHSDAATELLDRLQRGPKRAFVAWHTLSNLYYLVAPRRSGPGARVWGPAHHHEEPGGLPAVADSGDCTARCA